MDEQDQRVRDYYNNWSLPQDRLELLLKVEATEHESIQSDTSESSSSKRASLSERLSRFNLVQWHSHRWVPAGLAGAMVLLASLWVYDSTTNSERLQRTVREVAMNHTTRLQPEYSGESLAMLDNSMQQLPFALVLPKSIDSKYELVGSRYCSLSGVLAAHVRLKNHSSGKPMSLFVTGNAVELKDIDAQQSMHEGVEVEFWREDGLFFALAQRS